MNNKILGLQSQWIPVYLTVVAIICITQLGKSTMGPIETIIIAVLAGLLLAGLLTLFKTPHIILCWVSKKYRRRNAFIFIPDKKHKKIKKLKLPIDQSRHVFWIKAYKELKLEGFTIRFIPTKGTKSKSKQVPSSIIEIIEAKLKWDSREEKLYGKKQLLKREDPIGSNEASKWNHYFDKPIIRSPEYLFGIEIVVDVKKSWSGYFSIEGLTEPKCYGRIKVKIDDK